MKRWAVVVGALWVDWGSSSGGKAPARSGWATSWGAASSQRSARSPTLSSRALGQYDSPLLNPSLQARPARPLRSRSSSCTSPYSCRRRLGRLGSLSPCRGGRALVWARRTEQRRQQPGATAPGPRTGGSGSASSQPGESPSSRHPCSAPGSPSELGNRWLALFLLCFAT